MESQSSHWDFFLNIMKLNGKTAWVIGASSGIGKELCRQLAMNGVSVILSARKTDDLFAVQKLLQNSDNHMVLALDLENTENISTIIETIQSNFERIDMVFLNGGVSQRALAVESSIEIDRKIMEINYFGNITIAKALIPVFQKQGGGKFIVTSSIAGKFGFYLRSAYSASKHALHGFYESLALEEAKNGISVLMLVPGKINTEISKHAFAADGNKHGEMDHNQATGMPVDRCVNKILKAVESEKREVLIGNKEINAVLIKRLFPKLFWNIIKKQSPT